MPKTLLPKFFSGRRQLGYCQLIRTFDENRAIPIDGPFFKSGAVIDETQLRPDLEWPETPLLIEWGQDSIKSPGKRQFNDVHILWRYDFRRHEWSEIARVSSYGAEWRYQLGPIVRRALTRRPPKLVEAAMNASDRIVELLDRELAAVEGDGRAQLISFLYDRFAARLVREAPVAAHREKILFPEQTFFPFALSRDPVSGVESKP